MMPLIEETLSDSAWNGMRRHRGKTMTRIAVIVATIAVFYLIKDWLPHLLF